MRVAIVGATSHVAKNLIKYLPADVDLVLFARSPERVAGFLLEECKRIPPPEVRTIDDFPEYSQDLSAIVNCVGLGTPEKVRNSGVEVFGLTERFDEMILEHIHGRPGTRYVNLSSGVVHGFSLGDASTEPDEFRLDLTKLSKDDSYRVAKLNSEAKHRASKECCIFDLRLFGFFTRFVDLESSYLMTQMLRSIIHGKEFVTDDCDIVRDFVHPRDLARVVLLCIEAKPVNCALDVYSLKTVKKSEIIECFGNRYGLRTRLTRMPLAASPTGNKGEYVPRNHSANAILGYVPDFTSLQCLVEEADAVIEQWHARR